MTATLSVDVGCSWSANVSNFTDVLAVERNEDGRGLKTWLSSYSQHLADAYKRPTNTVEIPEVPPWMTSVLPRRVWELRSLQADWDSYGASPIGADVAKQAVTLLIHLAIPHEPAIEAHPHGGVAIEWDCGEDFVSLTVRPNLQIDLEWVVGTDEGDQTLRQQSDLRTTKSKVHRLVELHGLS